MGMYPKRPTPQQAMSFKELTAEFDRILKPLTQRMAGYAAAQTGQSEVYDTSGDCCHPILAAEPRNPATPPRALKIHRQRMVSGLFFIEFGAKLCISGSGSCFFHEVKSIALDF